MERGCPAGAWSAPLGTWDASVVDDPIARQILDEYYALPDTLDVSTAELFERFADNGLEIVVDDNGVKRPASNADLGIGDP